MFLDLTSINYVPLNEPLLHVVFCEDGTGIDRVMIGGKIVVRGRPRARRRHGASSRPRPPTAVARLAEVNAGARDFVQALEPVVLDYCVGLARQPYPVHRWCGH